MKRLIDDLDKIEPSNVGQVKRLLSNLESDIRYFARRNNKRYLKQISSILEDYISINKSQLYIDMNKVYSKKKFINGLISLKRICDERI